MIMLFGIQISEYRQSIGIGSDLAATPSHTTVPFYNPAHRVVLMDLQYPLLPRIIKSIWMRMEQNGGLKNRFNQINSQIKM
jgi:hypothetical protein